MSAEVGGLKAVTEEAQLSLLRTLFEDESSAVLTKLRSESGRKEGKFEVISASSQCVNGINYFVKIRSESDVNGGNPLPYIHARVYWDRTDYSLVGLQYAKSEDTPLVYFESVFDIPTLSDTRIADDESDVPSESSADSTADWFSFTDYSSEFIRDDSVYTVQKWAENHRDSFVPPVCNKLMYNGQLKVMFVGGPNTRKDYHIDCGEEFFYQMKGDIHLLIHAHGQRKLIPIRQGEVFLLPARVPHSPQRPNEGSLGLVLERTRVEREPDCLRYYQCDFNEEVKDESEVLWEKWWHCQDLGKELVPVVREFEASDECKTGQRSQPLPDPPITVDSHSDDVSYAMPMNLEHFINDNRKLLSMSKCVDLFPVLPSTQTSVQILNGPLLFDARNECETWLYVLNVEDGCDQPVSVRFHQQKRTDVTDLTQSGCLLIHCAEGFQLLIKGENTRVLMAGMFIPIHE